MELVKIALIFSFINYMVIRSDILSFIRNPIIQFLKKEIASKENSKLESNLLYLIKCPFCLTFWLSLIPTLFGLLPIESPFIYPVLSSLIWKVIDSRM